MAREQIVKEIIGQKTNASNTFRQVWKHVLDYEATSGNCLDNGLTREQYIDLLSSFCRRRAGFTGRKSALMTYVKAMVESGGLAEDQISILSSVHFPDLNIIGTIVQAKKSDVKLSYFKNFQALKSAIAETLTESDTKYKEKYDIPKSILFLAWFGLTEEEIFNLRKKDVMADGVMVGDRMITLPEDVAKHINHLAVSDGYYQKAKGVIFRRYVPSEYLIRTDRRERLDVLGMRSILYRMNLITGRKFSLSYDTAFYSGVYFRAYMLECESDSFDLSDPTFAAKVLCTDTSTPSMHSAAIDNYNMFKKLF